MNGQSEKPNAHPEAQHQPVAVPDSTTIQTIFKEAVKLYADEKAANAGSDERKERRDDAALAAQQDAARWTEYATYTAATAALLSFITIGLVWGTFWETRRTAKAAVTAAEVAKQALAASDRDTQAELRAYVFVKEWKVRVFREPDRLGTLGGTVEGRAVNYTINAVIQNSGSTPTRHFVSNINFQFFGNGGLPDDFSYPDDGVPVGGIIGPGSEVDSISLSFAAGDLQQAAALRGRWFIWGWVEYNDVFPNTLRHRTEFCSELSVRVHSHGDDFILAFPARGPFNGADGDCIRQPQS